MKSRIARCQGTKVQVLKPSVNSTHITHFAEMWIARRVVQSSCPQLDGNTVITAIESSAVVRSAYGFN